MVSLGEAYEGSPALPDRTRLYLGAGLLLVGTFVAAVGFASVAAGAFESLGLTGPEAFQAAIALAGTLVPALYAGSLLLLPADRPIRLAAAAGVTVAVLSVALFVFTVPPEALAPPVRVPVAVVALYAVGTAIAVWSPLGAASAVVIERDEDAPRPIVDRTVRGSSGSRRSGPASSGRVPADGGRDDDDVRFLLDEDERDR